MENEEWLPIMNRAMRAEEVFKYGRELPQKGEIWRHFKGKDYLILGYCRDCTNYTPRADPMEEFVLYTELNGSDDGCEVGEFMSLVDRNKYPIKKYWQHLRFEKIIIIIKN